MQACDDLSSGSLSLPPLDKIVYIFEKKKKI